ncbi:MAG: adhesin [Nitrosospira sp.]|nr:adhesin [Nitrosospira sp.]
MMSNPMAGKTCWIPLAPLALIFALAACDGDDKRAGSGSGKPETGPATGILTDAAVAGVTYLASSGAAGTTDERGRYNYTHGDTVEFRLGSLVLGKGKGARILTPIELAGDNSNRLQNILILFQSLDVDGNPENGIFIPADAAAAMSASLNLDIDPAEFAASAELQHARQVAGIAGPARTVEEANAHFLSQGMRLLSTDIWVAHDATMAVAIRASTEGSGEYLQGEATPDDSCDVNRVCGSKLVSTAGVEYGAARMSEFDTRGFKFAGAPVIDTNLRAGLSHTRPNWRIRIDGSGLIATDIVAAPSKLKPATSAFNPGSLIKTTAEEPVRTMVTESRYPRMEDDPGGIVGAWVSDTSTIKTQTYLFFSDGKFMMVDPIGDPERPGHSSCGGPGVEFASYTFDSSSKSLNVRGFTYDSNGCAGFSLNETASFKMGADSSTAILETRSGTPLTLYRISGGNP